MSNKTYLLPDNILTVNGSMEILHNTAVEITGDTITGFIPAEQLRAAHPGAQITYLSGKTMTPGFIQTHIHLCQTLFRGLADDLELLDWLQYRIFPYENAHIPASLRASVRLGLYELINSGTTTLLDMGTMRHQEVVYDELIASGINAFAGKCLIDENDLFPSFCSNYDYEMKYSQDLAKAYHNTGNGRVKVAFEPRFILSCSRKLMKDIAGLLEEYPGSIYHTHASENTGEINEVFRRYGKRNIDCFEEMGILGKKTVLAHCIHLDEHERGVMKHTHTSLSHCPSSNLKLASGIANIPLYLKEGLQVSLGADGAPCNNNLNALIEMRLAALIQKPLHGPTSMDAETVFKLGTIEGAKALNIENERGSLEVGKKADLVCFNLNSPDLTIPSEMRSLYSTIVYGTGVHHITDVMSNGEWLKQDGIMKRYAADELVADASRELALLLQRAK